MKQYLLVVLFFCLYSCSITDENKDKEEILNVIKQQEKEWSNHNLKGFMNGYWKNDSLKFYGKKGITYGWRNTLDNYKKGYPTSTHTGKLSFKINNISKIENNSYYVLGEYFLTREIGDVNGIFMIIFKRINGQWKIVADTSC